MSPSGAYPRQPSQLGCQPIVCPLINYTTRLDYLSVLALPIRRHICQVLRKKPGLECRPSTLTNQGAKKPLAAGLS